MESRKDTGEAITQWIYDPQNGNLISKRYQDGKGPGYIYTQDGHLQLRRVVEWGE